MLNNNELSKMWWLDITGPRVFRKSILQALATGKSVVIKVEKASAYIDKLKYFIESEIDQKKDKYLKIIDLNDELFDEDIEEVIEKRLFTNKSHQSLTFSDSGLFDRLTNTDVCHAIYWIEGIHQKHHEAMINFVKKAAQIDKDHCLFVIALDKPKHNVDIIYPERLLMLDISDHVSALDSLLFVYHMIGQTRDEIKMRYLPYLLMNMCGPYGDVAAAILETIDPKKDNPLLVMQTVAKEQSSMSGHQSWNDIHPYAMISNKKPNEIQRLIKKAQIQALFPLLEEQRQLYIAAYEEEIKTFLPKSYEYKQLSPYDLEIKDLIRLNEEAKRTDYVALFKYEDLKCLQFLKRMRNDIAHLKIIESDRIHDLFMKIRKSD